MAENEMLLYPLGGPHDMQTCPHCAGEMPLAKVVTGPGLTDYSTFRCPACNRSETFIDEEPPSRSK